MKEVIYDFSQWLAKKSYTPPKIEFYSSVEGIEKWAPIRESKHFIPQWYKDMPTINLLESTEEKIQRQRTGLMNNEFKTHGQTIKTCPGLQDIMTIGYTMPYWSQTIVTVTRDGSDILTRSTTDDAMYSTGSEVTGPNGKYTSATSISNNRIDGHEQLHAYLNGMGFTEDEFPDWTRFQKHPEMSNRWRTHPSSQYSTMINELPSEWSSALLKLDTVWKCITPPGYATLVVDPTYQFNDVMQAVPGVLNTDYWQFFNLFFFIKKTGVQFLVGAGQPLATYIPVKREKLPLEVRSATEDDFKREREMSNYMRASSWGSSYSYRTALKYLGFTRPDKKCPFHKGDK